MILPFGYTLNADFDGGFALFLSLVIAAIVLAVLMNRRSGEQVMQQGKGQHRIILFLRIGAIILLLLLIFDPQISLSRARTVPKRIAVILDQSSSMKNAWVGNESDLKSTILSISSDLEQNFMVDYWSMDGEPIDLQRAAFKDELSIFSWSPKLGNSGSAEHVYQAAFLISDGQLNGGRSPLDLPWIQSLPVYPIYPLKPKSNSALKILDIGYDRPDQVKDKVRINIKIQAWGLAGKTGAIKIVDEVGRMIDSQPVGLKRVFSEYNLSVETPPSEGQTFKVVLALDSGELQSEKMLKIEMGPLRKTVLLISERTNALHKFIRLNLPDSLYKIELILGTNLDQQPPSPIDPEKLHPDIIVLNQPGSKVLNGMVYDLIKAQISRAKPLILFHDGSEPVEKQLLDVMRINQVQSKRPQGEYSAFWTQMASSHPLYLELMGQGISPDEWHKYPPLYHGLFDLQLDGVDLLAIGSTMNHTPVLSVSNHPPMAIFSGGGVWRWFFHPQSSRSFSSLWRYVLLYLEEIARFKPVQVNIPIQTTATGTFVDMDIAVKDLNGRAIPAVEVRAWQENESGSKDVLDLNRKEPGRYKSTLITKYPGKTTIVAEAYRFGELWGRDTSTIQLVAYNSEIQSTGVNETFLERLAQRSGTHIVNVSTEKMPTVPKAYYLLESSNRLKGIRSPTIFVILVTALIIEWILRRRNGLL